MTKMTTKTRILAIALSLALVISNLAGLGVTTPISVAAATNGIVKGPDTPGEEDTFTTTLNSGESTTIKIVNSVLTIKVEASEYTFQIGNITKTTDAAVVNEKDGLLHILTLGGVYYVFDLYTGVQIIAYRNMSNGKYCSSRNTYAYMVYGKSLINNTYFYELLTSNSVIRELLMTRGEFDVIVNGGDPSIEITTQEPTVAPTEKPTEAPTVAPTEKPTQVPTQKPTESPTQKPTEVPTQAPTQKPTEVPTQAPTQKPTEVPTTQEPTTVKLEFNFEFWWKQYIDGVITWEQFTQVMWEYQWTASSESTEKSTTYYFYDDEGKLIRTETITISNSNSNGSGAGSANVDTTGKADVDINVNGQGGGTGNVSVNTSTQNSVTNTSSTAVKKPYLNVKKLTIYVGQTKTLKLKNSTDLVSWSRGNKKVTLTKIYGNNYCKVKVKGKKVGKVTVIAKHKGKSYKAIITVKRRPARVTTYKTTRRIYRGKNRLYGTLHFNRKTGVLEYRGYKVSGVTDCGFIKGSYNVVFIKNGKLYWVPKNAPKGSFRHKKLINCDETIVALQRNTYGFVTNARTDSGCVKNVSNK